MEYDYLVYIPGEAVAVRVVGTVDPNGKCHKLSDGKRKAIVRYILKGA